MTLHAVWLYLKKGNSLVVLVFHCITTMTS